MAFSGSNSGARQPGPIERGLPTARLEALSDGVFAIALTLLVLDIVIPSGAGSHLLRSVADLWPAYLAYVVSFSTIGATWLGHNTITEYMERADQAFVRLNLLLLLGIAFLPFPTKLFAYFLGHPSSERVAVTVYGITLLLVATLLLVQWTYAIRAHLIRPDAADEEIQLLTRRLAPGLGGYLVLIIAGLFFPRVAILGYLVIAVYYLIPFRRTPLPFHRKRRPARGRDG